ncbi:MAG: molybdenum cofactor biosynthesis protein [Microbacterium sp. SCN 70-200]|uniref:MogA/MoaB family molybdenum cofactor biosynthesis protein n=1 Tax=unclassified Microbacterium TaxID=2609290 RepID=UPI000868BFE5|nr:MULTISPECIES: MogA/MoaB family molybdenum cofactor biosynthesis protein [unclassified Microbacterium]MBN9213682.1 MogA/MoaB family molybdenum cofactor biosynthesis protein [Microbacterium sp.]ODT40114.1 MAG: molybdenum cofactor biosynthesis protein [Microbacterium sp. SCN 70-200]OJV79197.1 MAG: molybdenum cofactor biosynthesis protein [Microbacterium sp. 70-16]
MSTPAAVITVSDRSAAGLRADAAGPIAVAALREAGFDCAGPIVTPDGADAVQSALQAALAAGARLIVTTGGTGLSPRDQTPEGTARVLEHLVPGIAEELRRIGAAAKPAGMLSRGLAGVVGDALVVNLPGSPAAVTDGMPVILSVAAHVLDQLQGGDHS